MIKSKCGRAYAVSEISLVGDSLSVTVSGVREGRISLGGVFSELHSGRCTFPAAKIPDGRHTLFLHLADETLPLCELERCGGSVRRIFTEEDIINAEVGYIELLGELSSLEKRVKRLEVEAFESVLF